MGLSLTNRPADADKPGVRRDSFTFLLVGGGFIAIVPPALIHFVSPEHVLLSSKTHFWAVVASSLVATAAGVVLSFGGMAAWQRARRPRRDSLHGEATSLPLETRVLAVCDVHDSERVYREARSQERALGLLRAESPTGFDARCVEALERVLTPTGLSHRSPSPFRPDLCGAEDDGYRAGLELALLAVHSHVHIPRGADRHPHPRAAQRHRLSLSE
jgi:hypothetical protein